MENTRENTGIAGFAAMGKEVMDWDAKLVEEESGGQSLFRLLPEGEYDFEIEDLEKQYAKSGAPMILLKLIILPENGQKARVDDRLVLTPNSRWKLNQFFKAIGQFEDAVKNGMNWDKAVYGKGRLILGHRTYDGKEYNQVKAYVIPSVPAVEKGKSAGW